MPTQVIPDGPEISAQADSRSSEHLLRDQDLVRVTNDVKCRHCVSRSACLHSHELHMHLTEQPEKERGAKEKERACGVRWVNRPRKSKTVALVQECA